MDGPKLRLTGGPLDHRPNGQSKITSLRWSIGPSSIWTVKFCKFGRSELRHLDQGAFLHLPPQRSYARLENKEPAFISSKLRHLTQQNNANLHDTCKYLCVRSYNGIASQSMQQEQCCGLVNKTYISKYNTILLRFFKNNCGLGYRVYFKMSQV